MAWDPYNVWSTRVRSEWLPAVAPPRKAGVVMEVVQVSTKTPIVARVGKKARVAALYWAMVLSLHRKRRAT